MKLLVLDAMGVIFRAADDVAELLIPFARRRKCALTDAEISDLYVECSLGKFAAAELWRRLGIEGGDIDGEYLSSHQLTAGVEPFLETVRAAGISLACLSNDVAEWSRRLRETYGLQGYFSHWVVSGEVGGRKPDAAIYRALLAASGERAADCLFVDDRPRNLEAAARLGFQVVLFDPRDANEGLPYNRVRTFEELGRTLGLKRERR